MYRTDLCFIGLGESDKDVRLTFIRELHGSSHPWQQIPKEYNGGTVIGSGKLLQIMLKARNRLGSSYGNLRLFTNGFSRHTQSLGNS